MKRKLFAMLLAMAMALSGCSLALNTDEDGTTKDQLVGMYITFSNGTDDIWDTEEMGMEPIHTAMSDGKKLAAQQVRQEIELYDGILTTQNPYLFPGDYGIVCMTFYEKATEENGGFWNNVTDAEFADNTKRIGTVNDSTHINLESTIYVSDALETHDLYLYMNPVYQTPEGEVYALGTTPVGWDGVSMYDCSKTISQEINGTLPDGMKAGGGSVTLTVKKAVLPECYVILEMDDNNQIIKTTEYAPADIPEEYVPTAGAAYLILESRGAEKTTRTVYSPDDASAVMDTFYPGRHGICVKGYTHINWEG